jgi:dynein heavy chain
MLSCVLRLASCLQVIKRAVRNVYEMSLEDFIFHHPAQIALLGIQFQWTADTQAALVAAKSDKTIMSKNMKKTEAILRWAAAL